MPLWKKFIFAVLFVGTFFVWYVVFAESRSGLAVYVLDVGQGDSVFIQAENGNQILIDGGPNDAVLSELGRVMPFYDRSIDMLILTHPDADHLNGLVEVLKRYKIGLVVETGIENSSGYYAEWRRHIETKNIPVVIVAAGERFDIDDRLSLEVLYPFTSQKGISSGSANNTSIVSRLEYGTVSFLLTGDIEEEAERMLTVLSSQKLDADVLKVPHHGSKTSSTEKFLEAVTPEAAVISAGKGNRYGHPTAEVLERFLRMGAAVLRTDTQGTILFRSNGTTVWMEE